MLCLRVCAPARLQVAIRLDRALIELVYVFFGWFPRAVLVKDAMMVVLGSSVEVMYCVASVVGRRVSVMVGAGEWVALSEAQ